MSVNKDGIRYGYQLLAKAIVRQAVVDYRDAENNAYGRKTKKDVVAFIKSPYFNLLTNVDPEYLLKTINHDEKKPMYNVRELAEKYGVSVRTIYRRIKEGKIVL